MVPSLDRCRRRSDLLHCHLTVSLLPMLLLGTFKLSVSVVFLFCSLLSLSPLSHPQRAKKSTSSGKPARMHVPRDQSRVPQNFSVDRGWFFGGRLTRSLLHVLAHWRLPRTQTHFLSTANGCGT